MAAHCHHSLAQVLSASMHYLRHSWTPQRLQNRSMLLSVFYSRVKEARKDREICLGSRRSRKLNLFFKLVCWLEAFWWSRALVFWWGPEDLTGAPQTRGAFRCAPRLGLWACLNGVPEPGGITGQPGSHTSWGALWWEVSESWVPLSRGAASRSGEAFPKLLIPKAFTVSFWLRLMIFLTQLSKRWICRAYVVCYREAKSSSFPKGKRMVVWNKNSQKAVLWEMWFQNNLIFFGKIASLQPVSLHPKWFHCPADECSSLWSLEQVGADSGDQWQNPREWQEEMPEEV